MGPGPTHRKDLPPRGSLCNEHMVGLSWLPGRIESSRAYVKHEIIVRQRFVSIYCIATILRMNFSLSGVLPSTFHIG